jgi:DNA-binding ferritin-like protein (Dps family)|tara:strand:- start:2713 stop:3009 length:297 start_codon:yes stop_codon:yes gene_type:complete
MPKKEITAPIPLARWYKDLSSVKQLNEILESEVFKVAAATLKEIAGPSFNTLQDEAGNAQRHAWYAGYRDALNDLYKLANPPANNQTSITPDEWTHIE